MLMRPQELDSRIAQAQQVVRDQIPVMTAGFGRVSSQWKDDGTRVTACDLAISQNIGRALAAAFPDDQFFSEETAETTAPVAVTTRFCWVLDPIDGTNNFAKGLPQCAISLALLEEGEPVYGVIYDYARAVIIHGGPGRGLYDGERRVTTMVTESGPQAMVGFHSPMDPGRYPGHAEAVIGRFKIRGLGSSTLHLAYTAVGLFNGTVDHNVKLWDIAAAIPLVRAVGGEVRFMAAAPLPLRRFDLHMERIFYVAGSSAMCDALVATLPA
jgi:myo-inositol-1(or 4)-monophosphatase